MKISSASLTSLALLIGIAACGADDATFTEQAGNVTDVGGGAAADGGSDNTFSGGTGGSDTSSGCGQIDAAAESRVLPVDIIIAIDQSNSMDVEADWVEDQLNTFANQIVASSVDVRVIMIAGKSGGNSICVPAPLGSGSCPDDDNEPALFHVDQRVGSRNALKLILETYPDWTGALRPDSWKHFVVITDDDAKGVGHEQFSATIPTLTPAGMFDQWTFHAIAAATDCLFSADDGKHYKKLASNTGGVFGDLCTQNFQPVWDELSTQIVSDSKVACAFEIPAPPNGEVLDPGQVNVMVGLAGAEPEPMGYLEGAAGCDTVEHGWFYDNNEAPTQIVTCPQTCATLEVDNQATVRITLGCETIQAD